MISIMKPPVIQQILASGRKSLFEYEAKALCDSFGIPTTKFEIAKSEDEAAECALKIGFPVVLKIMSPNIIHKSDMGCVMLNI